MAKRPARANSLLSGIYGEDLTLASEGSEVLKIDPQIIQPNPFQPRKNFNPQDLQRLAESMSGRQIHPVLVTERDGVYILAAGGRRVAAAQLGGLPTVDAVVLSLTDAQLEEIALDENIHRLALNPLEEAYGIRAYMQRHHLSAREVAKIRKYRHPTVLNRLALLRYPALTEAVATKQMPASTAATLAKQLIRCPDDSLRAAILEEIAERGTISAALLQLLNNTRPAATTTPELLTPAAASSEVPTIPAPELRSTSAANNTEPPTPQTLRGESTPTQSPVAPTDPHTDPPLRSHAPVSSMMGDEEAIAEANLAVISEIVLSLQEQLTDPELRQWVAACYPTNKRQAVLECVAQLDTALRALQEVFDTP